MAKKLIFILATVKNETRSSKKVKFNALNPSSKLSKRKYVLKEYNNTVFQSNFFI